MDPDQLKIITTITTEPSTLLRGRRLLDDLKPNDRNAKTIASCSLIMAVASIEKMLRDRILQVRHVEDEFNGDKRLAAKLAHLLDTKLIERIKDFPFVASSETYAIESTNTYFHRIKRMVEHRNLLVHIQEGTTLMSGDDPRVTMDGEGLSIHLPPLRDPWDYFGPEEALEMIDAGIMYFNDVLLTEAYVEGEILYKTYKGSMLCIPN